MNGESKRRYNFQNGGVAKTAMIESVGRGLDR